MLAHAKLFTMILLGTASFVSANLSAVTVSIRVRTSDIDITTVHGQKILGLRIDRAARDVCDFASDQLGRQVRKIEQKCREDAKTTAWAAVKTSRRMGSR